MPKKKDPPLSAAEQRRRFEALVRETGAQGSAKEVRRVLGRIAANKRKPAKPRGT